LAFTRSSINLQIASDLQKILTFYLSKDGPEAVDGKITVELTGG